MTAVPFSPRVPRRPTGARTLLFEHLENRRLLAVTAGANLVPKAFGDAAVTFGNTPVVIDVLLNDYDPDGSIDPSTVEIVGRPKAGTVEVRSDGMVKYEPPLNRFGVDSFIYTVRDNLGAPSNPATVRVEVRSAWQNPSNALDVNGDGDFSPIDILRVINELNRRGAGMLEHPPQSPHLPPPYVDVTGDGYLTAADALFAINCLNSQLRPDSIGYCPLPPLPVFAQTHSLDGVPPLPDETAPDSPSGGVTDGELPNGDTPPETPGNQPEDPPGGGSTLPPGPSEDLDPIDKGSKIPPTPVPYAFVPASTEVCDNSWLDEFLPLLVEASRRSNVPDEELESALAHVTDSLLDDGLGCLMLV